MSFASIMDMIWGASCVEDGERRYKCTSILMS